MARTPSCVACGAEIAGRHYHAKHCSPCFDLWIKLKGRAHGAVHQAVKKGLLQSPKLQPCADCKGPATEYDHRDYSKPLVVEAVCRSCNLKRGSAVMQLPEKAA